MRITGIKIEVKDIKTELNNFKIEIKDFNTEIFYKINSLRIKFECSQKEIAHSLEKKLDLYIVDYKK